MKKYGTYEMIARLFSGFLPYALMAAIAASGLSIYLFKKNIQIRAQHKAEIDGFNVAIQAQNDHVNDLIERRRIEQESAKRLTELRKKRQSVDLESRVEVAKSEHECAESRFADVFSARLDSLLAD